MSLNEDSLRKRRVSELLKLDKKLIKDVEGYNNDLPLYIVAEFNGKKWIKEELSDSGALSEWFEKHECFYAISTWNDVSCEWFEAFLDDALNLRVRSASTNVLDLFKRSKLGNNFVLYKKVTSFAESGGYSTTYSRYKTTDEAVLKKRELSESNKVEE